MLKIDRSQRVPRQPSARAPFPDPALRPCALGLLGHVSRVIEAHSTRPLEMIGSPYHGSHETMPLTTRDPGARRPESGPLNVFARRWTRHTRAAVRREGIRSRREEGVARRTSRAALPGSGTCGRRVPKPTTHATPLLAAERLARVTAVAAATPGTRTVEPRLSL